MTANTPATESSAPDTAAAETDTDTENLLVEEVSIDGMCGVY